MGILGDSLSYTGNAWGKMLLEKLNLDRSEWSFVEELPRNWAVSGRSVADVKSSIDSWITAHTYNAERNYCFLINLGANDIESDGSPAPDETTWKTNYQYIIDALVAAFPGCKIILSKPSEIYADNNSATVAGYIDDLITANPGVCYEGDNELVWKKGADNYATMTIDGQHYSTAGQVEAETQKEAKVISVMGL